MLVPRFINVGSETPFLTIKERKNECQAVTFDKIARFFEYDSVDVMKDLLIFTLKVKLAKQKSKYNEKKIIVIITKSKMNASL